MSGPRSVQTPAHCSAAPAMRASLCAAFAATAVQGADLAVHATSSLTFDAEAAKNRPVTKVVNLLKDMLKQLEKEAEEDEEIYDQLACWCATNEKEKTKSVAEAEAHIKDLTTSIEDLTASTSRLGVEIKNLQKEIAEIVQEEKDLLQSIEGLSSAIKVLQKHNSASFLQVDVQGAASSIQYQVKKNAKLLEGVLTPTEHRKLNAFIQASSTEKYAPQSGEIFGILEQMKESFENNLAELQKEEKANIKAFNELMAAKTEEITAAVDQVDAKTQEQADGEEKLAQNQEDLADTKKTLSEDEAFLAMLKEKCSTTDAEWEERQKTRQLEMEACSKALAVLSSDEAHDLFTKTFNPAFVQTAEHSERQSAAAKYLKEVALKVDSPRLAAIAMKVKLDAFVRVKKAIDDMIAQLTAEKQDEIKHKDFCVEEFNTNQVQTERKEAEKQDLLALIEDLQP